MSFVRSCLLTAIVACLSPATAPTLAADRTAAPPILPRAAWAAKRANTSLMKPQTPREIVIHHTGEKRRPQLTLQEKLQKLQKFSQSAGMVGTAPKPPWGDVPYHFYVDAAGRIAEGRSLGFAGDSNTKYDTANRIQIVVEGHFDQEQPGIGAAQVAGPARRLAGRPLQCSGGQDLRPQRPRRQHRLSGPESQGLPSRAACQSRQREDGALKLTYPSSRKSRRRRDYPGPDPRAALATVPGSAASRSCATPTG